MASLFWLYICVLCALGFLRSWPIVLANNQKVNLAPSSLYLEMRTLLTQITENLPVSGHGPLFQFQTEGLKEKASPRKSLLVPWGLYQKAYNDTINR